MFVCERLQARKEFVAHPLQNKAIWRNDRQGCRIVLMNGKRLDPGNELLGRQFFLKLREAIAPKVVHKVDRVWSGMGLGGCGPQRLCATRREAVAPEQTRTTYAACARVEAEQERDFTCFGSSYPQSRFSALVQRAGKNKQRNCSDKHVILLTKHGKMRCNTRLRLGRVSG